MELIGDVMLKPVTIASPGDLASDVVITGKAVAAREIFGGGAGLSLFHIVRRPG